MQQGRGYRKGSRWFCDISRRRYIRIRNLFILSILFIIITCSCIVRIDKVCGQDREQLPDLPDETQAAPAAAEEARPEAPIYEIPLSKDLQEFTYQKCIEYDVDHVMVLAIIQEESQFRPDLVDQGNYGLMQINKSNHQYLKDALGTTDFLDPRQNIEAGIFWLSGICQNNTDPERILMVYNMNSRNAQAFWDMGRYSTGYSRGVMRAMDEIRGKQVLI